MTGLQQSGIDRDDSKNLDDTWCEQEVEENSSEVDISTESHKAGENLHCHHGEKGDEEEGEGIEENEENMIEVSAGDFVHVGHDDVAGWLKVPCPLHIHLVVVEHDDPAGC